MKQPTFPRNRSRWLLGSSLIALTCVSGSARAQEPLAVDRATSDGVDRLVHDFSGEGDASSLELNPALLQAAPGLDMVWMGYRSLSPYTRGTGFGGFMSINTGFGVAAGFGLQVVRPQFTHGVVDIDPDGNPNFTKLSFGLASGDGKVGAVGIGVHGVFGSGYWLRPPDLDIGLLIRMRRWASLGGTLRFGPADLGQGPSHSGRPELNLFGELSIRPLGTRMLELAGGVRARFTAAGVVRPLEALENLGVFPRGRLALRFQGIELAGEVEQVRVGVLDENTLAVTSYSKAIRGSVSMGVAWDMAKVSGGIHAGLSPSGIDGFGLAARFSTARQGRVFWPRLIGAERIDLSNLTSERDLIEVLERLERAEAAGKRSVLVVDARSTDLGWASLQEVRQALVRVRNAGGHVFAYLEQAGIKDYYLASVAEEIYIHPAGSLETYGLSATKLYFKGALDKLGVRVEALHIDEYKSAHEPFTRTSQSKPDREQNLAILTGIYNQVLADIATGRQKTPDAVAAAIDDAPYTPERAVSSGLADEVVYRDELLEKVGENLGARVSFMKFGETGHSQETWSRTPYIAVVLVEGTIIDGKSRHIPFLNIQFTGGDTIAETLQQVRDDPNCEGIVLRVNSGGGSALASDIIWREVDRTRKAFAERPRKNPPIVVSMGDVAGSGGYYVAMGARDIYAQPTTITGSIGVVSMSFDISGLLAKLGISTATLKQGKNADIGSIYQPMTADQRTRQQASMQATYNRFLDIVAEARKLPRERVHELGRGHVYTGRDAAALKLVDHMGGLHEAIAELRTRSKVPKRLELDIEVLPHKRTLLDLILENVGSPFGYQGIKNRVQARREAKAQKVPLALQAAVSRLPLSMLFLPQALPSTIMTGEIVIE